MQPERLVVGSKRFTESYVLAEIVTQAARAAGAGGVAPDAVHRQGLGNTAVVFEALKAGAIDVYPEYFGTIDAEVLKHAQPADLATMRRELAPMGLGVAVFFGFQNGYALAMRGDQARQLGLRSLSDLARLPPSDVGLRYGLSHEFLGRADGWPGLAQRYGLKAQPIGIDHGLAYEALAAGRIAVTDIYSTDAKIASLGLAVLADDRGYFPRYDALLFYRLDLPKRAPAAWRAIEALEGRIDERSMIALNGEAELQGRSFDAIARDFLARGVASAGVASGTLVDSPAGAGAAASPPAGAAPTRGPSAGRAGFTERLFADDLARLARQHVLLVLIAVGAASLIGLPLGAAAAIWPRLEQPVMAIVGLLQTIPSLALLAMLIPLLGRIGTVPALVALSLYALLPIVRNTATGLVAVPRGLKQAGTALGLTPWQRWRHVDLPLAAPVIVAGVKTAAVITVGTATIAAFIGAGGFGERIATGLALNDHTALLAGAVPAAVLALLTQALFELMERVLTRHARPARA
jgi:osmoprotectant transport system permease protein